MNDNNQGINNLSASGFTYTSIEFHEIAEELVNQAKIKFKGHNIVAHIWAYVEQGYECLSCDLFSDSDQQLNMPIIITAAKEYDFSVTDEPDVRNMTEALHLSGLIVSALNATIRVGLHKNETNESLFVKPFDKGQTNAPIDLTFGNQEANVKVELAAIDGFREKLFNVIATTKNTLSESLTTEAIQRDMQNLEKLLERYAQSVLRPQPEDLEATVKSHLEVTNHQDENLSFLFQLANKSTDERIQYDKVIASCLPAVHLMLEKYESTQKEAL